ncbi:hypothetical protein TNCT_610421 [Trichonephila clavata]|uniref:Uncharacterized protein n=1 Tax=Trichonephila clavata TaxID=2740835 RepID=A0A8X6JAT7_TRICU|nr:hypothetical protein TNCT_610421 [Trichonephila clavata]
MLLLRSVIGISKNTYVSKFGCGTILASIKQLEDSSKFLPKFITDVKRTTSEEFTYLWLRTEISENATAFRPSEDFAITDFE